MLGKLSGYLSRPRLYDNESGNIWEDEYISVEMLKAHLDPNTDAASRSFAFIEKSARWINKIAPASEYTELLDLGCGPGLYAEQFHALGYNVTGMDFSERSINYAKEQARKNGADITYIKNDYLKADSLGPFDVVTLIYCDYGALSGQNRLLLLGNVYRALRDGGKLIFDVFTTKMRKPEEQTWYFSQNSDFWSAEPHLCLESVWQYDDDDETELRRTVVCTDDRIRCYNIWDHFFTKEKLVNEVKSAGFVNAELYGDVAGKEFTKDSSSDTLCVVLTK